MLCEVKGFIFNGVLMLDIYEIVEWEIDLIVFVFLKIFLKEMIVY